MNDDPIEPQQILQWHDIDLIKRHESTLTRSSSLIVVIDVQEKLLPAITKTDSLIVGIVTLLKGAQILDIPVIYTEQYPKGLGKTDERILSELSGATRIEKVTFSSVGERMFIDTLEQFKKTNICIVGIETHVCVTQTALDLASQNFHVTIAADAVSSRKESDKAIALARMRAAGIAVSSVESILFEMLGMCGTPEFKEILKIIK